MIHKALTILTAATAVVVLALGLVSYRRGVPDDALWVSSLVKKSRVQVAIVEGTVYAVYTVPRGERSAPESQAIFAGFSFKQTTIWATGGGVLARGIGFPFWAIVVPLSLYPCMALVRGPVRRRHRRLTGRCLTCGYGLTGNVSGICPECGHSTGKGVRMIFRLAGGGTRMSERLPRRLIVSRNSS
ncbi:MAG: hypothetical protein ACYTFA_08240 [Planctomycetota bacterium]|jgi:hypothetical protein